MTSTPTPAEQSEQNRSGVVDGPGEQLGGAGGSSQDHLGTGPLGGDQQLGTPPG